MADVSQNVPQVADFYSSDVTAIQTIRDASMRAALKIQ